MFLSSEIQHIFQQRSLISRYPRYLLLQFKRFSQDGYVHKARDRVLYPSVLDMSPFVAEDAQTVTGNETLSENSRMSPNNGHRKRQASTHQQRINYHLYGVVCHYGTMQFGHYSSYARLPKVDDAGASEVGWRMFDDEVVEETSVNRVTDSPDSYILFYQLAESEQSLSQIQHVLPTSHVEEKPSTIQPEDPLVSKLASMNIDIETKSEDEDDVSEDETEQLDPVLKQALDESSGEPPSIKATDLLEDDMVD